MVKITARTASDLLDIQTNTATLFIKKLEL